MGAHSESISRPSPGALPVDGFPTGGAWLAAGVTAAVAVGTWALTDSWTAAFLAGAAALCAWSRPAWLAILLVVVAPLARSPVRGLLSGDVLAPAKTVAATFLGLSWLVRSRLSPAASLPRSIFVYLSAWIALTVAAVLHAVDIPTALGYAATSAGGLWVFLAVQDSRRTWRRRTVLAALAIAAPIAVVVILQYVIVEHHVLASLERFVVEPRTIAFQQFSLGAGADRSYRPSGTMTHPNPMGLYFAVLIPFAFALTRVRALPRGGRRALAATGALLFAALLATNSRAALLTSLVSMAILCAHRGYRRLALPALGLFLVAAGLYATPAHRQTVRDLLVEMSRIRYGLSGRNDIWRKSAEIIAEKPWLGVGPGNLPDAFVRHFGFFTPQDELEQSGQIWMIQTLGDKIVQNFNAHNTYLELWAELGVLGPLLFLIGVGLAAVRCERKAARIRWMTWERAVALATASSALSLVVYGVFDSQIAITQYSLNLVMAALAAAGLGR